ncbi:hypothetical protein G4V62_03320 [Bacillaceae bacterium SIJ1]|uniref:hypothetical protein n=1 Tax=Litoribacterium kuwaitense TaxID=1398745 RepID=UPI0013EB9600|nr:hypothetical protein [Litoribacterium kuwaitense]NGP44024.1 hypothetical protein [Litoribacterium kuwaitense]
MSSEKYPFQYVTHTVSDDDSFSLDVYDKPEDALEGKPPQRTLRSIDELLDYNDMLDE